MKGQKVPARRLEIKFWKGSATEEKIVLGGNVVDRWLKKKWKTELLWGGELLVNLRREIQPQGRKRERGDGAQRRHSITPISCWKL